MDFLSKGGFGVLRSILGPVMDCGELAKAENESGWEEWLAKQPTDYVSSTGRQYVRTSTGKLAAKPLVPPSPTVPRQAAPEEPTSKFKTIKLQPGQILEREFEGRRIAFEVVPGGFRYQGDPIKLTFRGKEKQFNPGGRTLLSIAFFIEQLTGSAQTWKQFFGVTKQTTKEAQSKETGVAVGGAFAGIDIGEVVSNEHGGKLIAFERVDDGFRYIGDTIVVFRGDEEVQIRYGMKLRPGAMSDVIGQLTQGATTWREFFGLPGVTKKKDKPAVKPSEPKETPEVKGTTAAAVKLIKEQIKEHEEGKKPEPEITKKPITISALTPAQQNTYIKNAREELESTRQYWDDESRIGASMYRLHPTKDIWGVVLHRGDKLSRGSRHEGKAAAMKFALDEVATAKNDALRNDLEPFNAVEHEAGLKQLAEWQKVARRAEQEIKRREEGEPEAPKKPKTAWMNEIKNLILGKKDWEVVSPTEHMGEGATDYTIAHPLITGAQGRMYVTRLPSGKYKTSVHINKYDPGTGGYDRKAEPTRITREFDKTGDDMRDWFKEMLRVAENRRRDDLDRYPKHAHLMLQINRAVADRGEEGPISKMFTDAALDEARRAIRELFDGKKTAGETSTILYAQLSKLKR